MYKVLDKDSIMTEIVPYLPKQVHGPSPRAPIAEIVNAVLYKLKSGVQWHMLPVSELFSGEPLHYKTVFGHYRKWCKCGAWRECWIRLLSDNRCKIDLSSGDFDGSHTTALRGGEQVEYQGRKRRRTTNALYLTDRQGLPLAMSEPVAGNHNDLYDIEVHAEEVFTTLEDAGIPTDELFVNGDSGFDSEGFRSACSKRGVIPNVPYNERGKDIDRDEPFDEELYAERYSVERTFAWMDGFRSVLNRFDTTVSSWMGFNFLAFIVVAPYHFANQLIVKCAFDRKVVFKVSKIARISLNWGQNLAKYGRKEHRPEPTRYVPSAFVRFHRPFARTGTFGRQDRLVVL